jgi:addiction module HigA family antidote
MEMYNPCHPGRVILAWMGESIAVGALAKHLGITKVKLDAVLKGQDSVAPLLALKLAEAFPKTNARFWMEVQAQYDLSRARRRRRIKIEPIVPAAKAA